MTIFNGWFSYGGNSAEYKSNNYGLIVTKKTCFGIPERDFSVSEVYGRNGSILTDNGRWKNTSIQYEVNMHDITEAKMQALADWLTQFTDYARIYDSYDTGHYREGILSGSINWTLTQLRRNGSATITFNCKPQRFVEEAPITSAWVEATGFNFREFNATLLITNSGRHPMPYRIVVDEVPEDQTITQITFDKEIAEDEFTDICAILLQPGDFLFDAEKQLPSVSGRSVPFRALNASNEDYLGNFLVQPGETFRITISVRVPMASESSMAEAQPARIEKRRYDI